MKDKALNLLFEKQMQSFTLAKEKYDNLKNVICKDIPNGVYTLRVQHNPARMISTNARIDKATLQNRDCFLCEAHRPKEQKGIPYGENYHIFINPYPIFTQHFTVPSNRHEPQLIAGRLGDMLPSIIRVIPFSIMARPVGLLHQTISIFRWPPAISCLWKKTYIVPKTGK